MSGYVRIHRALFDEHPAFRNAAEASAFAWMIAKAQWQAKVVRYKGHKIELQRGQLSVSVRDFAAAMDRDKAWVERLFKRLRAEAMIETRCETGVNIITICNYNDYQAEKAPRETLNETQDETDARQLRDTEQVREIREEEEELSSNDDSPSVDEPSLRPEHVFEFYQELAKGICQPVPRDFTPERRQLVRGRISQYPLEDFQVVFAKCRDSPFLRGDRGRTPLTFDWLMQKKNFQKVLEGNYDR